MIFIAFFFALSCKKECHYQNRLKGKIKSIFESDDSSTFLFKYDSLSLELKYIYLFSRNLEGRDTTITFMKLDKPNDSIIFVDFLHNKYKILLGGHQIKKIKAIDTITNIEEDICITNTNNEERVTSIYDKGFLSIASTDINFTNFEYSNDNCLKYDCNWIEHLTGSPIQKSLQDSFEYTTIANLNSFPIQNQYYLYSNLSLFNYYLQVGGYYFIRPNKMLISNIYTTHDNINSLTHFDYTILNNYITNVNITLNNNVTNNIVITYY